jgi:hypothetical protein
VILWPPPKLLKTPWHGRSGEASALNLPHHRQQEAASRDIGRGGRRPLTPSWVANCRPCASAMGRQPPRARPCPLSAASIAPSMAYASSRLGKTRFFVRRTHLLEDDPNQQRLLIRSASPSTPPASSRQCGSNRSSPSDRSATLLILTIPALIGLHE